MTGESKWCDGEREGDYGNISSLEFGPESEVTGFERVSGWGSDQARIREFLVIMSFCVEKFHSSGKSAPLLYHTGFIYRGDDFSADFFWIIG